MNLVFLGFPGSGKGTVSKLLTDFTQISTGDLLRKEQESGSALGQEIAKIIDGGGLVNDQMALKLIEENTKENLNYIFDGFPRTLVQAQMLTELKGDLTAVFFDFPKEKLIERIVNRRNCPSCGQIYNLVLSPPKESNTCDHCQTKGLIHRKDDTEEALSKRLKIFETEGKKVIEYYLLKGTLVTINADQELDKVLAEFKRKLNLP